MAERLAHDLKHGVITCGQIGRLMALDAIPVLPGDGFSQDLVGSVALSPLRRGLVLDSKVDICTFYVPYRHVYGQNWIDFIEQGADEAITFPTETVGITGATAQCFGIGGSVAVGATIAKWVPEMYRMIWNRYYRPPTTVALETRLANAWTSDELTFGLRCAHLKTLWSSLVANNISSADYNVSAAGSVVSLLDFAAQVGHLKSEQEREFFNMRYADLIAEMGGGTNISADDRPQLVMRSSFWASGYDVDGTTDVSLGQYAGRVVQTFRHHVPRYYVEEHGVIFNMMLVRFPPMNQDETLFLAKKSQPTYHEIAGDEEIVVNQPPYAFKTNEFFAIGDSTVRGYIPYGQWYRYQPPIIHELYEQLQGYPFLVTTPSNLTDLVLVPSSSYSSMFQTTQLGHWQLSGMNNCVVQRRLPSARDSLMYGG